jgi:hypothetical protein
MSADKETRKAIRTNAPAGKTLRKGFGDDGTSLDRVKQFLDARDVVCGSPFGLARVGGRVKVKVLTLMPDGVSSCKLQGSR